MKVLLTRPHLGGSMAGIGLDKSVVELPDGTPMPDGGTLVDPGTTISDWAWDHPSSAFGNSAGVKPTFAPPASPAPQTPAPVEEGSH